MQIQSAALGEVEIDPDKIVSFTQGMPGFEEAKSFVMLQPDPSLPFSYLQAVDRPEVAFLLTDPFLFFKEYDLKLSQETLDELQIQQEQDVQVWAVVTLRENVQTATMNLLAPVILNVRERVGRQLVLTQSGYSTRQPLVPMASVDDTHSARDGA